MTLRETIEYMKNVPSIAVNFGIYSGLRLTLYPQMA